MKIRMLDVSRFTAALSMSPSWCANHCESHAIFCISAGVVPICRDSWARGRMDGAHLPHFCVSGVQIYLHYVISFSLKSFCAISGGEVAYKFREVEEWKFAEKNI